MEIFRDLGFAGKSAEMLAEGLGVNRYGLYAEFRSKQAHFDAMLQRYDEQTVERNFSPQEVPGAGIDEVRELRRSVDPCEEAGFFTAAVLGLFVMLTAKATPTVIESAARVAVEHLEALRAAPPT